MTEQTSNTGLSDSSCVKVTTSPECVHWTLNRPERRNGLGPTMIQNLLALASCAPKNIPILIEAAKVASGKKSSAGLAETNLPTWIGGGDLIELETLKSKDEVSAFIASIHQFADWSEHHPSPVITLIDGHAIGGGAEFSLLGDIRIATRESLWTFKQGLMGLTTGFGGARRLIELVGATRAEFLVYGMKSISAEEALKYGLIHELVNDEKELHAKAQEWCHKYQEWYAPTFSAQKKMFAAARLYQPGTHKCFETELFLEIWGNPSHKKAVSKFLNR